MSKKIPSARVTLKSEMIKMSEKNIPLNYTTVKKFSSKSAVSVSRNIQGLLKELKEEGNKFNEISAFELKTLPTKKALKNTILEITKNSKWFCMQEVLLLNKDISKTTFLYQIHGVIDKLKNEGREIKLISGRYFSKNVNHTGKVSFELKIVRDCRKAFASLSKIVASAESGANDTPGSQVTHPKRARTFYMKERQYLILINVKKTIVQLLKDNIPISVSNVCSNMKISQITASRYFLFSIRELEKEGYQIEISFGTNSIDHDSVGYVYVLKSEDVKMIKIGRSNDISRRKGDLEKEWGTLEVVGSFKTTYGNATRIESQLHSKFKNFCLNLSTGDGKSEFFSSKCLSQVLKEIKKIKQFKKAVV